MDQRLVRETPEGQSHVGGVDDLELKLLEQLGAEGIEVRAELVYVRRQEALK